MPAGRPAIPAAMAREVREEAGHRCAIPVCRSSAALDIAHIEPYSVVHRHEFHNLILLCANDHRRFDDGDIPASSIRSYKANLAVLNGRYGSLERRLLQWFADHDAAGTVALPTSSDLLVSFLVRDGLLERDPDYRAPGIYYGVGGVAQPVSTTGVGYRLTLAGREFLHRWLSADALE